MDTKEELFRLPKHWGFVAVQNKRPYQNDWQNNPLTRSQLFKEISSNRSKVSVFAVELLQVVCSSLTMMAHQLRKY